MGIMDEMMEKQAKENLEEVRQAITAAVSPLQEEIKQLRQEVSDLRKNSSKGNTAQIQYDLDDKTTKKLHGLVAEAGLAIDSYRLPLYGLMTAVVILGLSLGWMQYKINNVTEDLNYKYDVVTGVLSSDYHYWWDGENFNASRDKPEAKRLEEAVKNWQKVNESMRKK